MERKDCKCNCHNDGNIRHTKDTICCEIPIMQTASQPCKCELGKDWHVACSIDPYYVIGSAQITDVKGSSQMENLRKYTGGIQFGYDPNTESLDISFRRAGCEWDYGSGIQINHLTESDKEALREYLEKGK